MSKEYSYNSKKYIWITDNLDGTKGCHACHFIDDAAGCYSMKACETVPYSYFVEAKKPDEETQETIKGAKEIMKEKKILHTFGGKEYELTNKDAEHKEPCYNCAFGNGGALCDQAGNYCVGVGGGYFVLHDKTKESKGKMILPTDSTERKGIPITTGVLDYFPLAIAEVAKASYAGNKQHHPDSPLFWDKTKSTDHTDCIARHLIDRGKVDSDGIKHSAKLAWRALALLEIELEQESK